MLSNKMLIAVTILSGIALTAGWAATSGTALCPVGGCPGGGGRVPPPPPQLVSPPDVGFQLSPCVSSANAAFVAGVLRDGLVSAMNELDTNHDDPPPNPEVRQTCTNGVSTFGGWLRPVGGYGSTDTATARNVGLSRVHVLASGETFGFNVTPVAFTRLVDIAWRDQARVVDGDGNPDPNGDFHLTSVGMSYDDHAAVFDTDTQSILQGPAVFLNIDGWYDGIQNTDFEINVGDFLGVTPFGALQCKTFSGAHATETTIDTILASLVGGAGGSLGSVIDDGPGCRMARRLPRTVLVPGTAAKIVFTYTRVDSFTSNGLTAAGTWTVKARAPQVQVAGPSAISAEPGLPFSGAYSILTSELRAPLTVSWTTLNGSAAVSPNGRSATMTWNLPSLAVGQQTTRNVTVRVTDADGVVAPIVVKPVVLKRIDLGGGDVDPTCKAKPWLPQCTQ